MVTDSLADAEALVRSLARPSGFDHPVDAVEVVETHISWILLTGEYAYKLKKPVLLPFADFSTLERREHLCHEELRLNRRFAPDLYLGVVPIGGTPDAPAVGAEPPIEFAVKMRQFPSDERLDAVLARGEVESDDVERLAERIAALHASLRPDRTDPRYAGSESVVAAALENFDELDAMLGEDTSLVAPIERWTRDECVRLAPVFAARKRDGHVLEGHGDLHTENIVRLGGTLVPFDALEFNAELRWTDRMAELGFLAMDLAVRGRVDLAFEFLNRSLEVSGDYDGLRVLRFYLVYRAIVRVKVAAIGHVQHGETPLEASSAHLRFALATSRVRTPLLVVTHGLSGSGKTTITNALIGRLRALRVRSDLERKRMHGLAASESSDSAVGGGLYTSRASEEVYAALERAVDAALDGGFDVIVDATFLRQADRWRFAELAERRGARFTILVCDAPDGVLRARVAARAARGRDASEATVDVLEHQLRTREPLDENERRDAVVVDTTEPIDAEVLAGRLGG